MAPRVFALTLLLSLTGAAVQAHHSIAGVYDSGRRLTLEGVITAFQFVNPHPFVEIETHVAGGDAEHWRAELDNRFELVEVGMSQGTLKPGDRVTIVGSAARDGSRRVYAQSLLRPADGFLYEQVGTSPRVRQRTR